MSLISGVMIGNKKVKFYVKFTIVWRESYHLKDFNNMFAQKFKIFSQFCLKWWNEVLVLWINLYEYIIEYFRKNQ